MMLDKIHTEHGYINRLLCILEQKLHAIQQGQPVNYSLIKDIVEYLHKHAECCHHPKEDVIYQYYQEKYADKGVMEKLDVEHHDLSQLTEAFADAVDMILMDAVIPLDVFADKLNQFVTRQRAHLEFEEKYVFPLIRRHFTTQDWIAVGERYQECECDPLFGDQVLPRYQRLHERLVASV
ncbi:hemerythrin domain-containing protein [Photobacterium sanguinicancri]|uniref:Hemerythrin domain-containing protein n=1 Tax=Photobacterium sanguinicancri TaxID=875932 RepID=A0AAW7Y4X4_9GAMM|nr:hemerythrin domain-containing protein [Photobacterium sanguinicancri]KXI21788.1 cation-binding protein [Photobacterium sanguinicancri]MDO6543346.1 hemerythrin domain-containing protein [Photobacterium sanguinicancri]